MTKENSHPNKDIPNKGGRPVQEEKKDKILSIRVDNKTYAVLVELCTMLGYKSLSAFAIDMMFSKGNGAKKYTPFNPDIERLFCDLEDSLKYALRLEKRASNFVCKDIAEDLQGETQHFKIFVALKAEALLYLVREEHFKQK